MRFATFTMGDGDRGRLARRIASRDGWWVCFGRDLLVYAAKGKWDAVSGNLRGAARSARQPEGDIRKGNMHLVVQKGRTFQAENPDVRVILDKGRYLVVDLPKAEARRLSGRADPCFKVEPLRENTVVYDAVPRAEAPPPSAGARGVVAALDRATFAGALDHLVSWRTRLSTGPDFAAAAEWARGRLDALGYAARVEPVAVGDAQSANVVARKDGTGAGRGIVMVVAHLDSINHPGGPEAPAPGADDNASGAAGVLALAAAMAGRATAHDLAFVLFGGEEQGLHGSRQYVAALGPDARARLRGVVNMDMIGSVNVTPPAVLLEGATVSRPVIDALAVAAAQHTGLEVQISLNPFASDHVPFIEAGLPAVLTIEGADGANDAIHTAADTLDRVAIDFAMDILRMNAGWLADAAGASAEAPGAAAGPPDCGCQPAPDPDVAAIHQVSGHYQALFAQYARLQRDGGLGWHDMMNWQAARLAYHALVQNAEGRAGEPSP